MTKFLLAFLLLTCIKAYTQNNRQIVIKPGGHTALITDVAATPDGKHVLTCSFDKTIKIWNMETGLLEDELLGESGEDSKGGYQKIGVSPGGDYLAAGCIINTTGAVGLPDNYGIRLFNISTRKLERVIPVPGVSIKKVLFTGRTNELAVATNQQVIIYDYIANKAIDNILVNSGTSIAQMNCLRNEILIATRDGAIYQWDRKIKKLVKLKDFNENIFAMDASDKSNQLAIATATGKLFLLSAEMEILDQTINTDQPIGLAFSPSGGKIVTGKLNQEGSCVLYSTVGNKLKKITEYKKQVGLLGAVVMLNEENAVTAGGNNHSVAVWNHDSITASVNELFLLRSKSLSIMAASVYSSMLAFSVTEMFSGDNFPHRLRFDMDDHQFETIVPMGTLPYMLPKPVLKHGKEELVFKEDPQHGLMVDMNQNGRLVTSFPLADPLACTFLPNGFIAVGGKGGGLSIFDFFGAEVGNLSGHTDYISSLTISADERFLVSSSIDGTIRFWKLDELKYNDEHLPSVEDHISDTAIITQVKLLHLAGKAKLKTSAAWYEIITALFRSGNSEAGQQIFNNYYSLKQMFLNNILPEASVFLSMEEDWIIWNREGYYSSSKNGGKLLGFLENRGPDKEAKFYPFEQFDLQYNRPDLIHRIFNPYDTATTEAFHKAWQRRIRMAGIDINSFNTVLNLPELSITNTSRITNDAVENLKYRGSDSLYTLDKIHIAVNGNPVYGIRGKILEPKKYKIISNTSLPGLIGPVNLSAGKNRIQLSVINDKGIQSLKETFTINYHPSSVKKPSLYILSIGVSSYMQQSNNLQYAAKDAADIAVAFGSQKNRYDSVYIYTLTNEQATLENIQLLKSKLMQTTVDDEVIVFFAGHGLLSKDYTYYFATHNVDFNDPSGKGISIEQIEDLLDGIPARKKLLLMDTCHSGEPDKESNWPDMSLLNPTAGNINTEGQFVKARGLSVKNKKVEEDHTKVGLKNSFLLLGQLFADLRQSSGTIIIAASSGEGFSLESEKWHNGVFTYAVIHGLQSGKADADKDGSVTVSELRNFVIDEVFSLTKGKQKPTVRRDNIENDFRIW